MRRLTSGWSDRAAGNFVTQQGGGRCGLTGVNIVTGQLNGELPKRALASRELTGPIFEPLRDVEAFKRFRLHPELRTLVWSNGADLAPEFLREKLRVVA
jgi:hypothetical protein